MSSSWAQKLESRLSALADGASQESIQTLAKWMGFNRKHGEVLAESIQRALLSTSPTRQWLYLQVIHEVLLLERDNPSKWERLLDFRVLLGEKAVLPCLKQSHEEEWRERVGPLVKEWDDHNVFGGPTLISQIRKALSSRPPAATEAAGVKDETSDVTKAPSPGIAAPPADRVTEAMPKSKEEVAEQSNEKEKKGKQEEEDKAPNEEEQPPKRRDSAASSEQVTFDFESEGIPYSKVDAREFLEPCKAIATLQIARDLRNDAAVQLSSLLSVIPEEVKEFCANAQSESEKTGAHPEPISKEEAERFAGLLTDDVLDADLEEGLQNAETFLEIVEKQREARKLLIYLLIQSRCQFGSNEAAEAFYSVDGTLELLQKRKALLSDAMDLEGLDFEEESGNDKTDDDKLESLAWYNPSSEPETKRLKTE